jgi:hypothetical protein
MANADVCANCGAPLELDINGRCRWCHAHVTAGRPAQRHFYDADTGLVPDGVDECWGSAPFIYLAMAGLNMLGTVATVQDYLAERPGVLAVIRELSTAVSAAGVRVRDDGIIANDHDFRHDIYTPEEIWTFDLAFDVIAMLGTLETVDGKTRALVVSDMRELDDEVTSHSWKKQLGKAGDGPAQFREMRAVVPRHSPHPERR